MTNETFRCTRCGQERPVCEAHLRVVNISCPLGEGTRPPGRKRHFSSAIHAQAIWSAHYHSPNGGEDCWIFRRCNLLSSEVSPGLRAVYTASTTLVQLKPKATTNTGFIPQHWSAWKPSHSPQNKWGRQVAALPSVVTGYRYVFLVDWTLYIIYIIYIKFPYFQLPNQKLTKRFPNPLLKSGILPLSCLGPVS